jgi:hypothetical protein
MARFIDGETLRRAISQLKGTAGPFLPIWLALKQMGLAELLPVDIDTQNSTDALNRLFSFGDGGGRFYFPMAHTKRFLTRNADASRSVVQTNVRQWFDGTGTKSPRAFLDVRLVDDGPLLRVSAQRNYPGGLGVGEDGFAVADGLRVAMPTLAWAVWYGRTTEIPDDEDPATFLVAAMKAGMSITPAEAECVFVDKPLEVAVQAESLTDPEINRICLEEEKAAFIEVEVADTPELNRERIAMTQTIRPGPVWLNVAPEAQLKSLLDEGHTAILLNGPPRTGKTRAALRLIEGATVERIQIHDGWSYAQLIMGQEIKNGTFEWVPGALLAALRSGKQYVVLEEVNRTRLSQALGEVFSLIDPAYRGPAFSLPLPDGGTIEVAPTTIFLFTMNNVDKSTEELDDALFGRLRSVDFPPRVEDLNEMLTSLGMAEPAKAGLLAFFAGVQRYYPLGHGYFAGLTPASDLTLFYLSAIRPVLANRFASYEPETVEKVDSLFDETVVHRANG